MKFLRLLGLVMIMMAASYPLNAENLSPANEWITLGTSAGPIPDAVRSQPANALVVNGNVYLADAGDGTAGRLASAGYSHKAVRAIFISHLHFDHTGGIPAILALRWQTSAREPITIYGPPGTRDTVEGIFAFMEYGALGAYGVPGQTPKPANYQVEVVELEDGSTIDTGDFTLTAVRNTHYSWPEGSDEWKKFQSFAFKFELPNSSIVYTGDTGPSGAVEKLAQNADLLVSEMMDIDKTVEAVSRANPNMPEKALANMRSHLTAHHVTPEQVGEMATRAKVKKLVATHLAPAMLESSEVDYYTKRVRSKFDGDFFIASDLDRF
ncbi:MAG: MBL fold metallo-hydrolase [Halieaceae bacterium]|nr:MBL fold metallo-hydrolase [Halieaceae bacterium]